MDRAAKPTAAGSARHQRGFRDLSLIPHRWNYDELRALEFSHLQTSLATVAPGGCVAAGSSLWYCSNSLQTIMLEFEWVMHQGSQAPVCKSIESIKSNLVPCRFEDGYQMPLSYAETQLCFGGLVMWLKWESAVHEEVSASLVSKQRSHQKSLRA